LLLLHLFPAGVEELDGAFAVYAEEPPLGFDVVSVEDVDEDWPDRWREFHHGVQVGGFWVGPPWEAILIDPGRAFGTGAHPTTRLTLELLQTLEPSSLLDVGCGSGVLSIAAAKLGFAPVLGVDLDDAAVEATLANAAANGGGQTVHASPQLQQTIDRARQNPEELARRLQIVPVVDGGRMTGIRLSAGTDTSLMNQIGLRPGDVVTAVNGAPVDSLARGQQIIEGLRNATSARVTVLRDGRPTDITISLK